MQDIAFYERLLADPEVRNRIKTVADCEELIDRMEAVIPHDQLPACYDWLVARRNRLQPKPKKSTCGLCGYPLTVKGRCGNLCCSRDAAFK